MRQFPNDQGKRIDVSGTELFKRRATDGAVEHLWSFVPRFTNLCKKQQSAVHGHEQCMGNAWANVWAMYGRAMYGAPHHLLMISAEEPNVIAQYCIVQQAKLITDTCTVLIPNTVT
eukprot:scpid79900/ scgid7184/ 